MASIRATLTRIWIWLGHDSRGRDAIILLFLTILALLPRLWRIGSAPAGMNGDEFFNAVDALRLGPGNWPVFFEGNNGREALFLYLMAVPLRLFGQQLWAVRLPAAMLGLGSVWLAFLIGRQEFSRRVGFLAAAMMAVSLWPVMQARLGYRAVSLTCFAALTVYLFGLALRRDRIWLWLAAGLSLGLTMYTYIPSRVFPLVIVGWLVWFAFTRRGELAKKWPKVLLSYLVALVVFAPYGLYMLQNADIVNQRIAGVSGVNALNLALDGQPAALLENVFYTLTMFIVSGDTSIRYHAAGRPVFDPLTGLIFYLGLFATIWFSFKRGQEQDGHVAAGPDRRASYALLLLWLGAMLGPSALLGADTSFLRSAGAIVPVYIVAAIGIDTLYLWVIRKWPERKRLWQRVLVGLVSLGLLFTLLDSWNTYFNGWLNDADARASYHQDLAQISRFLTKSGLPEDGTVFIAYDYVGETTPQTFIYYGGGRIEGDTKWFDHAGGFGWRPGDDISWYLVASSRPLDPRIENKLASLGEATVVDYENGDPAFTLYRVNQVDLSWEPEHVLEASFVDGPRLVGIDMPDTIFRGEEIPITLHFQVPSGLAQLPNRLTYAQVLLEDESGNVWGQVEGLLGYPEAGWQAGDRFVQLLSVDAPDGMPPGPLYLRVGLRDWQGLPFSVMSESAGRAGPFLLRSRPLEQINLDPDALVFDASLALTGSSFSSLLTPGLPANVSLEWLALEKPPADYLAWLELIEAESGETVVSQAFEIWPGTYPPSSWQKGEQVTTLHRLDVPLDIPETSDLLLKVRLTRPGADESLPVTQGSDILAEMSLVVREHLFDMPLISYPLEVQFGDDIRLLGYDLASDTTRAGDKLQLTLYWQAINQPAAGYTVFNHVVSADGQMQGQFDSPPVADGWLTTTWLPDEIIIDERTIPLRPNATPGRHDLNVGLYSAGSGQRLPVIVDGQRLAGDQLTLTTINIEP